jgi:hypothetical protein
MKSAKMWAIVLAVAVAGIASMSIARADETQAKSLFKAMSDYLAAQKAISFDYDSNLERHDRSTSRRVAGQVPQTGPGRRFTDVGSL